MAKFKRAKDLVEDKDITVPVSARVKASTRDVLLREAHSATKPGGKKKQSLSWLIGEVLEEYADWLRRGGK